MRTWIKSQLKIISDRKRKKTFLNHQPNTYGLPESERKRAIKLGFTPDEYVIYDLKHNDPADYISEWERQSFRNAVRDYRILLDNKLVFYNLIKSFANVNQIYACKQHDQYIVFVNGFENENIVERLKEVKKIAFKKNNLGGGEGFKLLEFTEDEFYINRKKSSPENILKLLSEDSYILEEYCVQGSFENALWPYSVNTLRMITVQQKNGEIALVFAMQRIGVEKEKCVDNACAGGIYAQINLNDGTLSEARSHAKDKLKDENGQFISYEKHPVTQTQIKGLMIPCWDELKKKIINLHRKISFTGISFIAWDVALKDSSYVIIEANTSCSVDFLQTFSGVRNREIGIWMKENGYIK